MLSGCRKFKSVKDKKNVYQNNTFIILNIIKSQKHYLDVEDSKVYEHQKFDIKIIV